MDWDLEVKRLIFDLFDEWVPDDFFASAKIVDNKLIISVSNIELDESKDLEVTLKEIDVDKQTTSATDPS